ncbi:MAG: hypothetical protein AAF591_04420 [Verrucomicrobiota bacterium]
MKNLLKLITQRPMAVMAAPPIPPVAVQSTTRSRFVTPLALTAAILLAPIPLAGQDQNAPASEPPPLAHSAGTEPLDPRPENHILDKGRVFTYQPEQYLNLTNLLATIKADKDVNIYAALYSFIINESIDSRAARLRQKWLADDTGVVLVYDRSTGALTLAATESYEDFLPRVELMHLYSQVADAARDHEGHTERLAAAVTTLADKLPARLAAHHGYSTGFDRRYLFFGAGLLIALSLLLYLGRLLTRAQKRADITDALSYQFPPAEIPTRFGAPNAGGTLAELDFSSPPPKS